MRVLVYNFTFIAVHTHANSMGAEEALVTDDGNTVDVEDGAKLAENNDGSNNLDKAVERRGTAFSACFEMFIAGTDTG